MKTSIKVYISLLLLMVAPVAMAQEQEAPEKDIKELLSRYNKMSVPYLSVEMLKRDYDEYILLDTRKKEEFEVSHLPGATWVGEKLKQKRLPELKADSKIVVYCSVGIRSEGYGEQLLKEGFTDVNNLYGSIFAWKDAGYEVVDMQDQPTEKVHVFSKIWAKYLLTGEKVY